MRLSNKGQIMVGGGVSLSGVILLLTQLSWVEASSIDRAAGVTTLRPSITIVSPPPVRSTSEFAAERDRAQTPSKASPAPNLFDTFVEAIIQVESGGDTYCIGMAGERGVMQIKESTWQDTVDWMYSEPVSFDQAFDEAWNREVGIGYLVYLNRFLDERVPNLSTLDRLALLAACYNAGPGAVERAQFQIDRLPFSSRSYVDRVSSLTQALAQHPSSGSIDDTFPTIRMLASR